MDAQEEFNAKCGEREAWLELLGLDPWTGDRLRLVKEDQDAYERQAC